MPLSPANIALFASVRALLETREKTIREWAVCQIYGTLGDNMGFLAYSMLSDTGPDNNWDGVRGAAMELKRRIDAEIVPEMAELKKSLEQVIAATAADFIIGSVYEITDVHGQKRRVTAVNDADLNARHFGATDDASFVKISPTRSPVKAFAEGPRNEN